MNSILKKTQVSIKVYAYSTYGIGLKMPSFDSVICTGAGCQRYFISGVGVILEHGKDADNYSKKMPVVFCGFASNLMEGIVITDSNNISAVDGQPSKEFAIAGYAAFMINAIKKALISVGENILVDVDDERREALSAILRACGANVFYSDQLTQKEASFIDAAIITSTDHKAWQLCKNTARIISLGMEKSIPPYNEQTQIIVNQTGSLSLSECHSKNGLSYPKHYVLLSVSNNLNTACRIISGFPKHTILDLFGFCDIVSLAECDTITKDVYMFDDNIKSGWEAADKLRIAYGERVDSGLLDLMLLVPDPSKYKGFAYVAIGYILGVEPIARHENHTEDSINMIFRCADGSIATCNIVKYPTFQYYIELHIDGSSWRFGQIKNAHYNDVHVGEETLSSIDSRFMDNVLSLSAVPRKWIEMGSNSK